MTYIAFCFFFYCS